MFITCCESERSIEKIKKEGFRVYAVQKSSDIEDTSDILEKEKPDWVVLDGYHFGPEYQRAIKASGYKLLVIDDYAHLEHYYADIILNQNYGSEKFSYNAGQHTRFLLGSQYVLLRREFLHYSNYERQIPDVAKKVLITMGGGDSENNTLKVIRSVNLIDTPLDVRVIIGASNPHYALIKQKAEGCRHNIEILLDVKDMASLMAWADVAVSSGGTTTWELAFMGLPSMLCIVADNQEYAVNALGKDRVFYSIGWIKDQTDKEIADALSSLVRNKSLRYKMHEKMIEVVDGNGVERVIDIMKKRANNLGNLSNTLRRNIDFGKIKFVNFINLSDDEKELICNWRNSDEIRKWMFTGHIISKEDHLNFIENLRKDDANFYWLVKVDNTSVGVTYFQKVDVNNKSSYFGIYSVKKGCGKLMLHHLMRLWFDILQMLTLKCELIEGNERAFRLYKDVGFNEDASRFIQKEGSMVKVISMTAVRSYLEKKNSMTGMNHA